MAAEVIHQSEAGNEATMNLFADGIDPLVNQLGLSDGLNSHLNVHNRYIL